MFFKKSAVQIPSATSHYNMDGLKTMGFFLIFYLWSLLPAASFLESES